MNEYLEQSIELTETFDVKCFEMGKQSLDSRLLRLRLLFEELLEYAQALGLERSFEEICVSELGMKKRIDSNIQNKKEILDALCDMQVILSGSVVTGGFENVFDIAMQEVHYSNMSKVCRTQKEAKETINKYKAIGRAVNIHTVKEDVIIVRDASTNKFLKGINFKEPNLEPFVE